MGQRTTIDIAPDASPSTPAVGSYVRYIGDYELLAEIARGGMGVVFKARQVRLKRVVALKMILAGRLASENELRRFHAEAEAAANLEHPHIVPIFEVGEQKGLHYFSMGYVDGQSLAVRLADGPLPPREAVAILRPVAEAVHYAHQNGVIHRDLKPGNILLDKQGQPRITDFGLAKHVSAEASEMTGTGQILGAASYMPPEQALGQPGLVREPADIYALGAVLYAMLTGRPPFQADNPIETLRQVIERDPVAPRQLNPSIPEDLETICLKCLEKSAARRYATAQEFAEELGRFLEGEPILARPISRLNRAWRWCKRNRTIASLLTAVAASLLLGIALSSYFAIRETVAHAKADENARQANRQAANLALNEADSLCKQGEANVGLLWMVRAHELALQADDADLADASRAAISGWLPQVPRLNRVVATLETPTVATFGPDEESIWSASFPQRLHGEADESNGFYVHDLAPGKSERQVSGVSGGRSIAADKNRGLVLLEDEQGRPRIWSVSKKDWLGPPLPVRGPVFTAAFNSRSGLLVTATTKGEMELWNSTDGSSTGVFIHQDQPDIGFPRFALTFDAAGGAIWSAGNDKLLRHWDARTGMELVTPTTLLSAVDRMAISPNGQKLAVELGATTQLLALQDSAKALGSLDARDPALDLAFSPHREILAIASYNNRILFWDGKSASPIAAPVNLANNPLSVEFDRTGSKFLIGTVSNSVEVWDSPMAMIPQTRRVNASSKAFAYVEPVGMAIWQVADDGCGLHEVLQGRAPDAVEIPRRIECWELSPDRRWIAGCTAEGQLLVCDTATGKYKLSDRRHTPPPLYIAISPQSNRALTLNESTVQLWNLSQNETIGEPVSASATLRDISFDSPGATVSIHDRKLHIVQLLRLADGKPLSDPVRLGETSLRAMIAGNADRLIVAGDKTVEIWTRKSSWERQSLGLHDDLITFLGIVPPGNVAYTAGQDRTIRTWDLESRGAIGAPMRNAGKEVKAVVSPDGRILASCAHAGYVQLWHLRTGRRIAPDVPRQYLYKRSPTFQSNEEAQIPFAFFADSQALVDLGSTLAYRFLPTPESHDELKLLIETWTGLELDGNDVRILPRDEWQKRKDRLIASGWKDTEFPTIERQPDQPGIFADLPTPTIIETGLNAPFQVVYSGNGRYVAVCNRERTKVWDAQTQALVRDLGPFEPVEVSGGDAPILSVGIVRKV